jgi:N-carbamoylputrescine amidase
MEDIKVAAVSCRNWIGQADRAIEDMERWGRKACERGAEFIVYPELNVTGFFLSTEVLGVAEPIPGPSTAKIVALARDLGATLCFGILENEADIVYNTQVIVNGDGILGKQRKIHMPGYEYLYWRSGFVIEPIDIGKARVGIAICGDAYFMEMIRTLYFKGMEVLVMPFAYNTEGPRESLPEQDIGVMTYRVNCDSNGCFGILANNAGHRKKTGQEGSEMDFPGWAGILGPRGEVISWTRKPGTGENMVVAELKGKKLYDRRRDMYFVPRLLMPFRYKTLMDGDQTAQPKR